MRPVLGDTVKERAVVADAIEGYKQARRAHRIWPEDEGIAHFFLSDGVIDGAGKRSRRPPIDEVGADKPTIARINNLFLELLGI